VKFLWPRREREQSRYVSGQYGRGERAFVALDCELPAIGCWARLAQERVTVP
jgi:hypothetical protein